MSWTARNRGCGEGANRQSIWSPAVPRESRLLQHPSPPAFQQGQELDSTAPSSAVGVVSLGVRFGYKVGVGLPNFLGQQHEGEGDRHVGSTRYAVTAPSRRASSLARSRALQSISAPPSEMILDLWRGIPFLEKWAVERRICSQLSLTEGPERGLQPSKPRIDQGTHTVDAGDWMRPNAHPASHVWRKGSNMAAASNMKWRLGLRKSCSEESCPFVEDE